MPTIPDPEQFTRALIDYFDDDSQPGYSPTAALDGNARISAHFPEHAVELRGQIDQMFESAFNLPDLASLALDDAMAAIRRFIASEYPFLPSVLQERSSIAVDTVYGNRQSQSSSPRDVVLPRCLASA